MTPEQRLRDAVERMRQRARQAAPGDAIGDHPPQDPSLTADLAPDTKPAREAPPPRHWQEAAEDHDDPEPALPRTSLSLEMGDLRARGTACARLRRLLSDAQWHEVAELVAAGGLRYGARLLELRRGLDGRPPVDVESEPYARGRRAAWRYRIAPGEPAGRSSP